MDIGAGLRIGFEAFNRRDWVAVARGLPEDFEAIDRVPPDEVRVRGPDALRTITEANGDTAFAGLTMEIVETRQVERAGVVHLVARIAARASGEASGVPLEGEIAQVWTYEDGVPRRMEQLRTWNEALASVGN